MSRSARRLVQRIVAGASASGLAAVTVLTIGAAPAQAAKVAHKTPPIISSSRCTTNRTAGTITYLSPFGYDASAGIIDVYAAQQLGYFKDLCLNVKLISPPPTSTNPVTLVSAGKATITGVGSAADTLSYIANKVNITSIATYANTSDYSLVTDPSITSLTQLAGKTLGYKVTMPVVLTEMLQKAKVDVKKVNEVEVTTYDPAILAEGKVQALQVYQSNEPITLAAEHHAFKEWIPANFGVSGTFNTVIVNRDFLHAHRAATADFLRAELHAYEYCAAHESACVSIEAKLQGSSYDKVHSAKEWAYEAALIAKNTLAGKGVGVQTVAEWLPEDRAMAAYGITKTVPSLTAGLDTKLAASLYAGKRLIWPGS